MENVTGNSISVDDCTSSASTSPCNKLVADLSVYASDPESDSLTFHLSNATNSYCSAATSLWCNTTAQGKFYISGSYLYLKSLPDADICGPLSDEAGETSNCGLDQNTECPSSYN